MRALWLPILLRAIPVVLVLGVMGYLFAEAFLIFHKMNGGISDPANDSVRWRTPISMALFGLMIQIPLELLTYAIRKSRARAKSAAAIPDGKSTPVAVMEQTTSLR